MTNPLGTCMMDLTQTWSEDDVRGTHLEDPPGQAYAPVPAQPFYWST
jgi:hypothetical protein